MFSAYSSGTTIRTRVIDEFVLQFGQSREFQIVSLGCGFDTRPFRMMSENKHQISHYYELDLKQVVDSKVRMIRNSLKLSKLIEKSPFHYKLLASDLEEGIEETLFSHGFQKIPTLFIAECVLIYLDPAKADKLLSFISSCPQSSVVVFEQSNFTDTFGSKMLENVNSRGLEFKAARKYKTLDQLMARYSSLNFRIAQAVDMEEAYQKYFDDTEKTR